MKVTVTSKFLASTDRVWELLQRSQTLVYVAEGVMTYDGEDELPERWEVGTEVNLKPRLYGRSQGNHYVQFMEVNPAVRVIETMEWGGPITRWNHTMSLIEVSSNECEYTDAIEIQAGLMTIPVWAFAQFFYRHRHRRWLKLLKEKV
tara:strand:- start:3742 stop:4182 length:441 start_codon:yes stop_codon:yes gene_type:complete